MSSLTAPQFLNQLRSSAVLNQPSQSLQQGSLVGGKVLKLYPQAKALVQIGGGQMNAQLEASLSVNERYVFQVQQTKPMLRLKVVEGEKGKTLQSSTQLLHQLGISSPSKSQMSFVNELIQRDIPFTRKDLKEALQILEQWGPRSKASQILLDMFSRNLPVKSSVFQALYTKYTESSSLTASLQSIFTDAGSLESQTRASLGHQLQQVLGRKGSGLPLDKMIMRTFMNAPLGEQTAALQLLQRSGHISNQTSLSQIQTQLTVNHNQSSAIQTFASLLEEQVNGPQSSLHSMDHLKDAGRNLTSKGIWEQLMSNKANHEKFPILKAQQLLTVSDPASFLRQNQTSLQQAVKQLNATAASKESESSFVIKNSGELKGQLVSLFQQQLPVSKNTKSLLHQFSSILNKLTEPNGNMPGPMSPKLGQALNQLSESLQVAGVWSSLKGALSNHGASQPSVEALGFLIGSSNPTKVLNENRSPLKEVANTLSQVMNNQLPKGEATKLIEWLRHGLQETNEIAMSSKDRFLVKLKAYTQLSGINYEYQLAERGEAPSSSLKGSILQAMQDPLASSVADRLQRVLNHLNAAPIMMQESEQSIQFNVQMPGEWFGIEQDVTMDVEGNKKENGEIDPDYCHILFYLDLQSLKETVIDMRIQKRVVQLTLFTENSGVEDLIHMLKPSLEKGLEQLNYKLSTVRHKEINLKDSSETAINRVNNPTRKTGGFDLKI
ncbi:hypothetical protein [Pontibacillus salipaludis]|uniref:Flagellar hook-length control protein FliK n=1 Tax=Pontibacillus salipaludis TaxID=1697394 RepID=A0ABQ1QK27_9BACI|nr:hypothetical protein [Pontibacillus salipaludis]GGD27618.1 hypothetical protein GCM10011389_38980 [Pontibacillus salipaludis]